jgi:acyl-CoA reductase-like NAD-dependent aldehyde dehydrogenase
MIQNVNIVTDDPSSLMKKRFKTLFDHAYEIASEEFKNDPYYRTFAVTMDRFCDLIIADIDNLAKLECEEALRKWQHKEHGENISPGINKLNEAIKKRFKDGL